MADQDSKVALRASLETFDTAHLHKVYVTAYDRWNWDTSNEADKDWFEIAEEILKERGVDIPNPPLPFTASPNPCTFSFIPPNGTEITALTLEQCGDLSLGTNKYLKIKDGSAPGYYEHELFEVDQNCELKLGWELKVAIINFLANELDAGSTAMNNGGYLKDKIADKAVEAVRTRL